MKEEEREGKRLLLNGHKGVKHVAATLRSATVAAAVRPQHDGRFRRADG